MSQLISDVTQDTSAPKLDAASRRVRLREFQAQLVERMQAARSGIDTRSNQLGVLIGTRRWLLNLQEAGEIISVGTISPVPLTQDWFLGLSNMRGNLVGIIDFARYQGFPLSSINEESRIVAFAPTLSFNCGLLVSKVMGLRNTSDMELRAEQEEGNSLAYSHRRFVDRDAQVWHELDLSMVVCDPKFLHVGL